MNLLRQEAQGAMKDEGGISWVAQALSRRETEILTWVARGKSNTDIGVILHISPHTVSTHLKRILTKLDVGSRTTAAVRAAQLGLLPQI